MKRVSKMSILLAAGLSFLLSVYLWFSGYREQALFVGIWVPSILSLGILMLSDGGKKMNDLFIFIFGLIATVLAVGPLVYAAIYDSDDKDQ